MKWLWLDKFCIVLVGLDNEQYLVVDKISSLSFSEGSGKIQRRFRESSGKVSEG